MRPDIPMTDLPRLMSPYMDEVRAAIDRVVRSGLYIGGQEVARFEGRWAGFTGLRNTIGTGNGTDALAIALRALGIGSGDKVATVSLTAVATVAAIEMVGAVPVWVDVDAVTMTMSASSLERVLDGCAAMSSPIRAVVPVHLYGHPADMPSIMQLAGKHGCYVIEDCSQAHGASIRGSACGGFGHFSAYSFYPTKNLGCLGDGGALCTDDDTLAASARMSAQYGWRVRDRSEVPGVNSRLDPIQAAVLNVRLDHLSSENARRREIARQYDRGMPVPHLTLPVESEGCRHVYHQYVVRTAYRGELIRHMSSAGIFPQIHYPFPVHQQPAYAARCREGEPDLSLTDELCGQVLSIPVHPAMDDQEVGRVIDAMQTFSIPGHEV